MKRPGFALATTIIILGVSLISLTMLLMILGRSFKLTRSHADALLSFYTAEAGESYGIWKLSSLNDGSDKETLANCLAQNEECPGGLTASWSYALPSDATASFTVAVSSSGQEAGSATISSLGQRQVGSWLARRRTRITAFKPVRQLVSNDQTFNYAIFTDRDLWTNINGSLRVDTKEGEPIKAGIHANGSINQYYNNRLYVDGPVLSANLVGMPQPGSNNVFEATLYRGTTCGWSGCNSMYSGLPKYCFSYTCDGYVNQVTMPGLDINSARDGSLKSIARQIEDTDPTKKIFYNGRELYDAMENARVSGANDGWYTTDGPITYVNGQLTIDLGHKLRVPGILVVQGNLQLGIPERLHSWQCTPAICTDSTELDITDGTGMPDGTPAVTGLVATGDISIAMYMKQLNFNGLMYSLKGVYFAGLNEPLSTSGVIVARDYVNTGNANIDVPFHHHTYDSSKIHLLTQGTTSIGNLTTSYTGHWEEEY